MIQVFLTPLSHQVSLCNSLYVSLCLIIISFIESFKFLHDLPSGTVHLNNDGWLVTPSQQLLMWIPPALGPSLYLPATKHIIHPSMKTQIEIKDTMAHGNFWTR